MILASLYTSRHDVAVLQVTGKADTIPLKMCPYLVLAIFQTEPYLVQKDINLRVYEQWY